uniref:non-specific protein-tyrosine kinase n=1 Tax=Angiostrongylus cantonensis TaxID=6313 RepID=A0A0K0CWD3_ANGCA
MLQVRWPLAVEGLAEIKEPGQQVTVTDVVEKKKVKIGNNEVDVRGLVQTSLGLVPISYLEPKSGQMNRWWLGRLSPVEVGLLLSRDPALIMGSYAEMDPLVADEWAEFMLVVRNISGDVEQWIYEWEIDYKFNERFSKSLKKRNVVNDIICGPPHCAVPPIAYYVIKRTPDGMFYLDQNDTFSSIDLLLSHYYSHLLPLNSETNPDRRPFQLFLQGVMNFDLPPYTFPRPVLGKLKPPNYLYDQRSPMKLVLDDTDKSLSQYKPRIAKRLLSLDKEQKESLFKAYLYYDGIYNPVTIRKLRPTLFNQKAFDKDIEKIQEGNIRNGYSFLSHIIGLGFEEDAVCAGMRFLELNGLCHRHLRASNIIVHQSTTHIYAVKITDYMVPYHFLDKDAVEGTDGSDLEWLWWAPECLMHRTFNIVTDVWAFGCVIFEVEYTFLSLQTLFAKGEKMELPSGHSKETYLDNLFSMCTSYKPNDRPSFDYVFKFLRELLFDFAVGPEAAIKQYIKKSKLPKRSSHRKTVTDS